ncbi:MAG: VWA domain-containing protein [Deltaproteobacteria bacterium]|nr:VWA domain-containing protein [Deltaproteobacteria bacterium]MBK8716026.1 VWA domain-containing protein [Deltaproteobacteria bacterium]
MHRFKLLATSLLLCALPGCAKESIYDASAAVPGYGVSMEGSVAPVSQPPFNTEAYAELHENDFVAVADDPRSTFSIDVDTASYSNTRRFLRDRMLPPAAAVRLEELINYFDYDYEQPAGDAPVAVAAEVAPCPWQPGHLLVHVGLQGRELVGDTPPRNLVFLLDVSGSMGEPDKLPLLKHAMSLLARQLREQDRVSIVVYAGASGVVLEPTNDPRAVLSALSQLESGGGTNGSEGIIAAYELAERNFHPGAVNRIILATDGDFNIGVSSVGALVELIEDKRDTGVFLSVLGFGTGNLDDASMEALADHGNGNYAYIDGEREAEKVLLREVDATLVTVAKDVKVQVEWNPAEVASYRLIGYENRLLAHQDFNDDTKDAGEVGAGHEVTALYEVVPVGAEEVTAKVDPLKYQGGRAESRAATSGELMTLKVRYKQPDADDSQAISLPVRARTGHAPSEDFRFAAAVAEFGLLLRDSKYAGTASWRHAIDLAKGAVGEDRDGDRREFLQLVRIAARLKGDGSAAK